MGNQVVCYAVVVTNTTGNSTTTTTTAAEDGTPGWYLLAGMGFTLLSSLAVSLGTVLQKKAHVADQKLPDEQRAPRKGGVLCTPLWVFGFLIMVVLQIPLSFAALALAPQSIVIPLGASRPRPRAASPRETDAAAAHQAPGPRSSSRRSWPCSCCGSSWGASRFAPRSSSWWASC